MIKLKEKRDYLRKVRSSNTPLWRETLSRRTNLCTSPTLPCPTIIVYVKLRDSIRMVAHDPIKMFGWMPSWSSYAAIIVNYNITMHTSRTGAICRELRGAFHCR